MKCSLSLSLYIRNAENYVNGGYDSCFTVFKDKKLAERLFPEYIFVSDIEVDMINISDIRQAAVAEIDTEITKVRAASQVKLDELEAHKANLLSLEHKT